MAAAPETRPDPKPAPAAGHRFLPVLRFAADTAACIRFFSRLPLPPVNSLDDPASLPDFTRSARAAPLAGLFVAVPAAALGLALGATALPAYAVAVLVVAGLTAVTGALHEDGLSDSADGFFGGATPERRLEIMKDSRIGAFGAIALILTLGLNTALIAELLMRYGSADAMLSVLAAAALSRALMVWQWHRLPPARPGGLGARFGQPSRNTTVHALGIGLLCLVPVLIESGFLATGLGALLAMAAAFGFGQLAIAKIGGMTGDVLGAVQQAGFLGFLTGVLVLP
ncbi:adenosylcobinamide-GDP ribazoletransferase [Roseibium aquae]|uniref:Adenosylcobinamide-GDP ribazoletransferase n=1 Tax=Roseibium aquae TaxID=1323746 RepID=A0A916TF98_9HYPH|nr:adenosylcobinamide-GDP ribazoletransferase [Roseibium aquae]GGB41780.1 adenosylcobinamide-GDP ribazoletransferase [Roseibium aquae]